MYNLFTEVPTLAEFARTFSKAFISYFVFIMSSCCYNVGALTADLTLTLVIGVYVYQNNIYLKQSPREAPIKITSDGKQNTIFNGIPDWVYEEEMLATKYALWWSPSGKYLAYVQFNDSDIPVIEYSYFGEDQYPRKIIIPYPKAGAKNPTIKVFIVDTTNTEASGPKEVPVPAVIASSDHYFTWLTWVTDSRICVQWLKRIQNFSVLAICDFKGDSNTWDSLECETDTCEVSCSKVNIALCYFSPRISIGSKPIRKQCITCNLRKERCQYYTARFSERSKYYALICYGMYSMGHFFYLELRVLEDNWELQSALQEIKLPKEEIKKLEVDGITLWYKMLLPPQFDRTKKYPLLIQVYGGPCSQNVKETFSISWITYLASKEEIIVALVDGRGTAYQGDKILHAVYRRLGVYEVEDQISAVKKFIEMGFIDEKRIAIWGWSYGGYVTSLALGSGSGVFKCGMAVAPVSSWEYYASIYTERFMGLPVESDNLEHYKNSTVMARAKNFQNVEYLLIHGTADDNVHFQNSAQIAKALVNAQVDFQAMWYTDQNHGIPGLSSKHLYTHMTHFLKQCFSLSE
uniref:Fibroblast activation protein alpha n=1 Tax=Falco tinnunculus TaxID=100819 RepID=A0A8C4V3C9_FALTI